MTLQQPPWWHGAIGYEVYLRSFLDSDGDGIGDLEGVRRRLPYLADLGVDIVWITPAYPSPDADHGYDVADYVDIDRRFGDLTTARDVVAEAHQLGLRVVFDLVPNHTSDRHPWFQAALTGPDSPFRDYYVWRDPSPGGGPPNNWVSNFGGPAWTFDEPSGQYYLHLFLPQQPDLNWEHDPVRREFERILEFWFELGIDGFRIDVAHGLLKDPDFRDNPLVGSLDDDHPRAVYRAYDHLHDIDQPGVVDIYRDWRRIAARFDAVLIGEVYLLDPRRLTRYVEPQDGLHSSFCFPAVHTGWDHRAIRDALVEGVAAGAGALAWPLSSHDDPRAAQRFGGGRRGAQRALAYLTLLSGLPAMTFLHQGDELGLDDGVIDPDQATDPVTTRNRSHVGRDGSRTPMPWDDSPHFGFTSGTPWLPVGRNRTVEDTVAWQQRQADSHLAQVQRLLEVRRGCGDLTGNAGVSWLHDARPDAGRVVGYQRGTTAVVCNFADQPVDLPLEVTQVLFRSCADASAHIGPDRLRIPPDTAMIVSVRRDRSDKESKVAKVEPQAHRGGTAAEIEQWFREQGLVSQVWSNAPGDTYASHQHPYHKTLVCVSGSITFHTPDGDLPLEAGDRMELPPGTAHAATVGDDGVTCIEAARGR